MKDLEKIKSEDLACQVADANPGNFAIEQEVAQLVGATVPAPTAPSADDARELGAQHLVFLRRALLPIRSALRTAVAAIYAHLDSRCTNYTPAAYAPYSAARRAYDPMGTLPARSVANLLTAITAFSGRIISAVGAPDGMPFMTLMTSKPTSITKIGSTEPYDRCYRDQLYALFSALPNLNSLDIHCKRLTGYSYNYNEWFPNTITTINGSSDVFEIPELERFEGSAYIGFPTLARNFKIWSFPKMKWSRTSFAHSYNSDDGFVVDWVEQVLAPNCDQLGEYASNVCLCNFTNMWKAVFGNFYIYTYHAGFLRNDPKLIHLEFGAGGVPQSYSLRLGQWNPSYILSDNPTGTDLIEQGSTAETNLDQFLQNFKEHIALRLTSNGSGLTLTLSQAVRDAIHAAEATYGIEAIIVTQKGWTLSPAPGASSQ